MLLNHPVSLRTAAGSDWPAVARLLSANKLPLDGAREHLATFTLAVRGDAVVGCAGLEIHGEIALLRSVAVTPGQQRQGVGKALLAHALQQARARRLRRLYLLTVTAPEYFAQFGFKRAAIDAAPPALQASAEFRGACPACAAFMTLDLKDVTQEHETLPVAVIGAGPVGLAAAARLIERGIEPLLLEAGASVGANLVDYAHVQLFSPWRYNVDAAMRRQLEATGWRAPPAEDLPLAGEVVERLLKPFAEVPQVARALHLNTRVVSVSREGIDKVKTAGREKSVFLIRAVRHGEPIELRARAVLDASGTWSNPNPLGADGLPARGEHDHADAIFYGIPDVLGAQRVRYAGRRTLVVGAGHSAANTLLALAELARADPLTRIAWAVRSPNLARVFGGGSADALPARGKLGIALKALRDSGALEFISGLRITSVRRDDAGMLVEGLDPAGRSVRVGSVDQIVVATGQRPDLRLTSELRLKLDPWLESTEALGPLIDPNVHSCGTVRPHGHRELAHPEPGFYTVGVKSYGRAPTFLMATGYEQVRSVVAAIAGDLEAADRVELDLPETGVCGVDTAAPDPRGGCCGVTAAPAAAARDDEPGCATPSCGVMAAGPAARRAQPARASAARCCG